MLRAEHVALAWTAARPQVPDGELDRVGWVEHAVVRDPLGVEVEQRRDSALGQDTGVTDTLELARSRRIMSKVM